MRAGSRVCRVSFVAAASVFAVPLGYFLQLDGEYFPGRVPRVPWWVTGS